MRWAGHVARNGEMTNVYKNSIRKNKEKRPVIRRGRRLEDNIKVDLTEMLNLFLDWIHVAQNGYQ